MSEAYLHGYSKAEQERLVAQAEYWRANLVRPAIAFRAGERVLEIGCGAGAVLGVAATEVPGVELAGIDREERQVAFARRHLASLDVAADVRVGDARELPWEDGTFDHVFAMWFVEHLRDALPALREALRVLRPGGSITLTETDYSTFRVDPESAAFDALADAQYAFYARFGNPVAGRRLGVLLHRAGFEDVASGPVGFHFFRGDEAADRAFAAHVGYVAAFLEPAIGPMARALGADRARLVRGLAHLRSLPEREDASMSQIVYRARARRPRA